MRWLDFYFRLDHFLEKILPLKSDFEGKVKKSKSTKTENLGGVDIFVCNTKFIFTYCIGPSWYEVMKTELVKTSNRGERRVLENVGEKEKVTVSCRFVL